MVDLFECCWCLMLAMLTHSAGDAANYGGRCYHVYWQCCHRYSGNADVCVCVVCVCGVWCVVRRRCCSTSQRSMPSSSHPSTRPPPDARPARYPARSARYPDRPARYQSDPAGSARYP
eukprot:2607285-Rhodomonas_salina.1